MFYKNILLQTINEKINFTNKNLILEAKDLTKNPLFSTILFLFQYDLVDKNSLSNNVNVREELTKGVPIKKIKGMLSKEDLEKITKNESNNQMIDNEIKNYQNLLDDTETVTHDNIFNGKSLFDAENQKNLTFNEFQSTVHGRMSKIALNKKVEIKNDGKNTYEDLKNEFVYDNNGLQVYKSTTRKACVDYVHRVSQKDQRNYSFCISWEKGNLFYRYRYQDKEAAIFFVYDSNLPPSNPKHLLVIGVRPQYDGSFLFMSTEGDNDRLSENENIEWEKLLELYPKLEPLYTVFTQNLEPISEDEEDFYIKYSGKYSNNFDTIQVLKENWNYLISPEGISDLQKIFSFIEYEIPFELFSDKRLPAQLQHEYIYNVRPLFNIEMLKSLKNKEDLYFIINELDIYNETDDYLNFSNSTNIERVKYKTTDFELIKRVYKNLVRTFSFTVVVDNFENIENELFDFIFNHSKIDLKHLGNKKTDFLVSKTHSLISSNWGNMVYLTKLKDGNNNQYIPDEKIQKIAVNQSSFALDILLKIKVGEGNYIPSEELQKLAVSRKYYTLEYLTSIKDYDGNVYVPSKEVQKLAVGTIPSNIEHIIRVENKKPDRYLQKLAVTKDGLSIQYLTKAEYNNGKYSYYIPDDLIQELAIRENSSAIQYLTNIKIDKGNYIPKDKLINLAIKDNINNIRYLINIKYPNGKRYIPSNYIQKLLVTKQEYGINYLTEIEVGNGNYIPSDDVQKLAILKNPYILKYLVKLKDDSGKQYIPSDEVQKLAVYIKGSIIAHLIIKDEDWNFYIPSEKVQLLAIYRDRYSIEYIKNPYPKVIKFYEKLTGEKYSHV
jgi:hypothetical protein